MPHVTITLEDLEDGQVNVKMKFEPPARTDDTHSPAQMMALRMLEAATDLCPGVNEDERRITT